MCTARLFLQGVDLFALKFYLDRVVPINHCWHQKTEDTGLPDGKDRIPVRYLVLTQYRSVTDRQTDRRTDLNCFRISLVCVCSLRRLSVVPKFENSDNKALLCASI